MRVLSSLVVFAVAFGAACSDPPKRPAAETDIPAQPGMGGIAGGGADGGARQNDGGADGGDAGDACTVLTNTGAVIDQNAVPGDPPAGSGGAIGDGTYAITEARLYLGASGLLPGPTGSSFQGTIRVAGQTYERIVVFKSSGGAAAETRAAGTFTPNGINGTIALTCPSATQEQVTYSATATSLIVTNLVTKESFTFTKKL